MDYVLLDTFLTVSRLSSFSKAAEAMNCVQSNITSRIKRLENHFGQALLERGRGGARMTGFGHQFQRHAQKLLSNHQQVQRELMDMAGKSARFRLGSMETTAGSRLPPILKWLTDQCPDSQLSLHTSPTAELTTMVWEHQLDAALVAGPVDEKRFHCIPAFHEKLVIARPIKGQKQQTMLAFRSSCSYRNIANEWLRSTGNSDTSIIEMGTLDGMLGCVEAGMGFAIFPERAIKTYRHFDNIHIEAMPEKLARTTTFLIWRYDHKVSDVHKLFADYFSNRNTLRST